MTRFILGLCLAGGIVGCTGIRPVGPLAGAFPAGDKATPDKDKDGPPEPVTVPTPKPTPPLNLVDPAEVNAADPYAAAQKLMSELEADRKTIPTAPRTAEISRIKNGVKQN